VQTDTSTNYGCTTSGSFAGMYHSASHHMVTGNLPHMQKAMTSWSYPLTFMYCQS